MFDCLRCCFGGRQKKEEAEKDNRLDPVQLEEEYQQIRRGMEARLATASIPERIRIPDLLRSQDKQWFPPEKEEENRVEMDEQDRREERRREKGKEKETLPVEEEKEKDGGGSSSSSAAGSPQFRALSPMPMGFMPSPPMTAVLQPVLTDLPDEMKFSSLSLHEDGEDSDEGSDYCGSDRATEAGDGPDNVSALGEDGGAIEGAGFVIGPDDEEEE
ncbi:hypothetical protein PG997_004634 [Apiospora hydei]|uniref:Uncharacterized protein n=1 Tax=Apiospora hydei TaxID=1337664 RepID=A0ABR1X2N5_9PEZI